MTHDRAHLVRRLLDLSPLILLAVLLVVFAILDPRVISGQSLINIVSQATPIAVLALGAMIVLITAGIDLSTGVGVAFCAVLMASLKAAGVPLGLALLAGLVAMTAIGALNGAVIAYLKIPPFVTTLAAMVALQGATLAVASSGVLILREPVLQFIGVTRTLGLPNIIFLTALIVVGAAFLLRRTRFGLRTYALGSDAAASELAGIPIARHTVLVYTASGVFVFLCALVMVARVPIVTPNLGGTTLLLDAIAAAVLGGTSIFGGRGTVWGTIVGALIVSLLTTALRIFGTDPSSLELYKGAIIMVALLADSGMTLAKTRLARAA
ncbi:ABC transporter permease [Psychromarinibacter halotolerans]|uniref:ABC transporter permease n=1 Tax=Psychromarinibacter halotolerans TaxID=1775175 RepID=A0ABV7GRV0_9RHOB|nr:ABC transporter permease [Psychromarinibacter halotolerans]MDF0598540.1 ABC transporter permease [Psychromarinibacter halotolerans]